MNAGSVLLAVRFVKPYRWTDTTTDIIHLRGDGLTNGYIIEDSFIFRLRPIGRGETCD